MVGVKGLVVSRGGGGLGVDGGQGVGVDRMGSRVGVISGGDLVFVDGSIL